MSAGCILEITVREVMRPTISVLTPCYNSATTLAVALASLCAQTYEDWECIVVDDGSRDDPGSVVEAFADSRIRFLAHRQNMGRAGARNTATANAAGEFIAMLDADDWLYPAKLEHHVQVLQETPSLALVSSYMAIVNAEDQLVGVRGIGERSPDRMAMRSLDQIMAPPIPFAPSMFRASDVSSFCFDTRYSRAEDSAYLLKLVLGRSYVILPEICYAYRESQSETLDAILRGHEELQRIFGEQDERSVKESRKAIRSSKRKSMIYRLANRLGLLDRILMQRNLAVEARDIEVHEEVLRGIRRCLPSQFRQATWRDISCGAASVQLDK